jgi:two-component system LytT family response regulator
MRVRADPPDDRAGPPVEPVDPTGEITDDDAPAHQRASGSASWLERIAVEMRGKVKSVPVDQIDYIVASGPYAELHVGDRRHLIREAMQTLEERLDPQRFMRVHRSMIVRLDLIETLHRAAGGDYEVQLRNGARVKVSRSRREALERWLGVSE